MAGGREMLGEIVCMGFVAWPPVDKELAFGYTVFDLVDIMSMALE
jgi:hypothetical protein